MSMPEWPERALLLASVFRSLAWINEAYGTAVQRKHVCTAGSRCQQNILPSPGALWITSA